MSIKEDICALFLCCALVFSGCTRFNPETKMGNVQSTALEKIGLEITSHLGDHQTFLSGDTLSFFINLEREAYLLVIYEDAAGHLTQIIPNAINKNGYSLSGLFMPLPEENAPYRFKVQAPFGQEKVWVFAADRAFQKLEGEELANGLLALKKDLSVIIKKIRTKKMTAFGEATLTFQTQAKNTI
ncbi:MAG: DUF4384 domain-containing protein [Nitrospirae bacterium]|nr:DUF4384 domain-containing protein [Candidatus Manganitrophaceae bacterium]